MEDLLMAWIQMDVIIRGNRLLKEMSLNEMIIFNVLYYSENVTAALLCKKTKLLKSQMNRVLTMMEEKNYIIRQISEKDKRMIVIKMTDEGKNIYIKEHKHVMGIVNRVENTLGKEKAIQLASLMQQAVEAIEKGE